MCVLIGYCPPERRGGLCAALETAFAAECGGDMRWLRQEMEKEG